MPTIALPITTPDEVDEFRHLTQELHDAMRPNQRTYATCNTVAYTPMSREGFLDTALQNVNIPATMMAVAIPSEDPRQGNIPFLECMLVPIRAG